MRRNQNRKESVTAPLFEALTTQFEMKYPMLCERAKVYSDQKNNISIQVNRSERRNSCYFKLYNNKNYAGASKVARIDMKSPAYVYHFNGDGKGDWILNSEEKSMLVDLLSRELPTGNTLWQEIIIIFNREGDLPEISCFLNIFRSTFLCLIIQSFIMIQKKPTKWLKTKNPRCGSAEPIFILNQQ